jgi:hypothetical protein
MTCYIASALMTLGVVSIAVAVGRRGPRVFKLALAVSLLLFSVMAFLALLMLRA